MLVHASGPVPEGLTEPDPDTGDRWSPEQVWGHMAELVPYWLGVVSIILTEGSVDPVPFGRDGSDPLRMAGIERGMHEPPTRLMAEIQEGIAELSKLMKRIDPSGWSARGRHPAMGVMDVERIIEQFEVGHLEAHERQLDLLGEGAGE